MCNYITKISKLSIQSKYLKWYVNIIERAQSRTSSDTIKGSFREARSLVGQVHGHHILPRCMCSSDSQIKDIGNYAFLTPKEHYICHWLLCKMFTGEDKRKMVYAFRFFRTWKNGSIRITSSAYGFMKSNYTHSVSTKAKISSSNRGKVVSTESRAKMSVSKTGTFRSEEAKRSVSLGLLGHPVSPETRKKISESNKGKTCSIETRSKLAEINIGRKHSEEAKRKMSISQRGRTPFTEEEKLEIGILISNAKKGKSFSVEHIKNLCSAKAAKYEKMKSEIISILASIMYILSDTRIHTEFPNPASQPIKYFNKLFTYTVPTSSPL